MVTLRTDYGEFSANTEAEAAAQARKAKRAAQKKVAEDTANLEIAERFAYQQAYRILDRFGDEQTTPPAWRYHEAGAPYSSIRVDVVDDKHFRLTIAGGATREYWLLQPVASVEDGSGNTMAVYFRDGSERETVCYAMGSYAKQIAMVGIAKRVANWFRESASRHTFALDAPVV